MARLGQPGRVDEKKNDQRRDRRAFAQAHDNSADTVEGFEKQQSFRSMQQPANEIKQKVHEKKNDDEGRALKQQRRQCPQAGRVRGRRLKKSNRQHETGDQAGQRKNFSEKAAEKSS